MTTGPTDVTVTTAAGGPDGMPLALKFNEGLGPADAHGPTEDFSEGTVQYYRADTVLGLVEAERESCALACESEALKWEGDGVPDPMARLCAVAIRARGGAHAATWQPMNTAPRDCKPVLLFDGSKNGGVFVGHEATFPNRHWVTAGAFPIRPTHWSPLPAGPNVRVEAGPTARRQARAGENVPRTTGPGLVACRWASPRTRG